MRDRRARTRFDTIRQCERDMRVLCRDMCERRLLQNKIERLNRNRIRGLPYSEIDLEKLKRQKRKLDQDIPPLWERLHNRMNRDRARRERIKALGPERSSNGI